MRKLAIITSSINPREGNNFFYTTNRSHFTPEIRLQQTIYTINCLKSCIPNVDIAVVDTSENNDNFKNLFEYFGNTKLYPIKDLSPEVFEITNTHKNKSHCECLLLNTFYNHFKKDIKEYDYVIKTSGRYFHFNFNDTLFTEENRDKIFFKFPRAYEWKDEWNYSMIDVRAEENHNFLKQYCTVLYAFGTQHLDKFIDMNEATIHLTKYPELSHYDIETLYYYFMRSYRQHLIQTNWLVSGWCGVTGRFWYY